MKQVCALTIVINSSSQRKLHFLKLQVIRSWKLIQDICIRWNFIYLMLWHVYQLRNMIDIWVEKFLTDAKIQAIWLKKNEWSLVLLVDNMLNSFYELTLIVSKIININIHLKFQMFDALFNHLNVIKTIVRDNACTSQALVLRACELTSNKLAKYYFKTKSKNELIYNLAMIDNKIYLYKMLTTNLLQAMLIRRAEQFHQHWQSSNSALFMCWAHTQSKSETITTQSSTCWSLHIHRKTATSLHTYCDSYTTYIHILRRYNSAFAHIQTDVMQ